MVLHKYAPFYVICYIFTPYKIKYFYSHAQSIKFPGPTKNLKPVIKSLLSNVNTQATMFQTYINNPSFYHIR